MCNEKKYPLLLNGDTFNALKSDFDQQLRQLLSEMERRESEEATMNIKILVSLQPDQERDFEANGYDAMKDIVKPSFKHEVSTVMQVKSKKSGSLGGNFKLVWDRELCQYVMKEIDNGQITIFDHENDTPEKDVPLALPEGTENIVDADYRAVEEAEGEGDEEDIATEKNSSDGRTEKTQGTYEYLKTLVGADIKVIEAMGIYTVRTRENQIILSSAFHPNGRFYCPAETLAPHVGHAIVCIECPGYIAIRCDECDETLYKAEVSAGEDYEYSDPDDGEETM